MSEKIADDYGLAKLLEYLNAHAYSVGENGTFALATDADMDAILNTGETFMDTGGNIVTDSNGNTIYADWCDKMTLRKSIGYWSVPAYAPKGICNYAHVPGNSNILEYMLRTFDIHIGQNGPVSQPSGGCAVPYYLNVINKQICDAEGYANAKTRFAEKIKAQYDAHQASVDEHYANFTGSNLESAFTKEDREYINQYAKFLGKSTSTADSWTYAWEYVSNPISYEYQNDAFKGMIYNAGKVVEKATAGDMYPKLRNIEYFQLLFGTIEAYVTYLSGGVS